jgi:hypothetical protein
MTEPRRRPSHPPSNSVPHCYLCETLNLPSKGAYWGFGPAGSDRERWACYKHREQVQMMVESGRVLRAVS